ncbi:MAG: YtxH domain-containing protein [Patescibacteria group bacterium]
MPKSQSSLAPVAAGIGLGVGALAGVAGALFLYGKEGIRQRKKIKGWMLKLKGEILDEMEQAQELSKEKYHRIVDDAAGRYRALQNIDTADLEKMATELKGHWIKLQRAVAGPRKTARKATAKRRRK